MKKKVVAKPKIFKMSGNKKDMEIISDTIGFEFSGPNELQSVNAYDLLRLAEAFREAYRRERKS